MSASMSLTSLNSQHRRNLAAVVLRGELTAYDATPAFRATVDRVIDELLESYGALDESDTWDVVTERIVARFAHRLPKVVSKEPRERPIERTRGIPASIRTIRRDRRDIWASLFTKRITLRNYL